MQGKSKKKLIKLSKSPRYRLKMSRSGGVKYTELMYNEAKKWGEYL